MSNQRETDHLQLDALKMRAMGAHHAGEVLKKTKKSSILGSRQKALPTTGTFLSFPIPMSYTRRPHINDHTALGEGSEIFMGYPCYSLPDLYFDNQPTGGGGRKWAELGCKQGKFQYCSLEFEIRIFLSSFRTLFHRSERQECVK